MLFWGNVIIVPALLADFFAYQGEKELSVHPTKIEYSLVDVPRVARYFGVTHRDPKV